MTAPPSEHAPSFWKALGPGVLFAGAAVGVSHLVQSTRAGAGFGLALVLVVIAANLAKYPAFRFGPHYAAATGHSLLEGYRKQGRWALALYGFVTLGTMFTVQAAVTFVSAALGSVLLGRYLELAVTPFTLSAVLTVICSGLLAVGQYRWLDRITKVIVATFTLCTLAATAIALPSLDWSAFSLLPSAEHFQLPAVLFVAALVGWMPSAVDIAVWQSLWTLARERDSGHRPSLRESMMDFHIGYWGTAVLSLCFVVLGAGVMFGQGEIPSSAPAFAAQFIQLYVSTLGDWSAPLISLAAFAVMFSTTLTVIDGFPRAIAVLVARLRGPEIASTRDVEEDRNRRVYWAALAILAVGSMIIINLLLSSLTRLVDIATTLSFLTAPVLAMLNHRAVHGADIPEHARPRLWLTLWSLAAIAALSIFAAYYLYLLALR